MPLLNFHCLAHVIFCRRLTDVYILAPKYEFPEIIYAFFGGCYNPFNSLREEAVFLSVCASNGSLNCHRMLFLPCLVLGIRSSQGSR